MSPRRQSRKRKPREGSDNEEGNSSRPGLLLPSSSLPEKRRVNPKRRATTEGIERYSDGTSLVVVEKKEKQKERKTGKHDEQGSTEESDDVEEEFFTIAGLFEEVDNEHDEEENNSTKQIWASDKRYVFDDGETWEKPPDIMLCHHHPTPVGDKSISRKRHISSSNHNKNEKVLKGSRYSSKRKITTSKSDHTHHKQYRSHSLPELSVENDKPIDNEVAEALELELTRLRKYFKAIDSHPLEICTS